MQTKENATLTDLICLGASYNEIAEKFQLPLHVVVDLYHRVDAACEDAQTSVKNFMAICDEIDQKYSLIPQHG